MGQPAVVEDAEHDPRPSSCGQGCGQQLKVSCPRRDGPRPRSHPSLQCLPLAWRGVAHQLQRRAPKPRPLAQVSVALSIGLGIASGASPTAGLRTAIWGGLICGLFGSSPFNVIGPAGALTGMLSTYSAQWGEDILPWIALFSGIFVTIIVSLRLQVYVRSQPCVPVRCMPVRSAARTLSEGVFEECSGTACSCRRASSRVLPSRWRSSSG